MPLSGMVEMSSFWVNTDLKSMCACRQRWIFLRVSFVRCACADE